MDRPSGKKKHAEPHAILERTLERYPWARLSDDKGNQLALDLLTEAAGDEGRAWMVTPDGTDRLPGPFDADLYVALCQLYNAAGRPESRTVGVTFAELAELMGRTPGGGLYQAVKHSLTRMRQMTIKALNVWREGGIVSAEVEFSLLAEIIYVRRQGADLGGTLIRVEFHKRIAASIAEGNFRLLNTGEYFDLKTPTARRLYRYLDYRRWRGAQRLDDVSFSLKQIAAELPIDRQSPSHIKRTLEPAHAELLEGGFLSRVEYEERPVPGKKRPEISARYFFSPVVAAPALVVEPPPRDSDDQYLRDTVQEILNLLKDDHSTGFYVKVVRTLPDQMLRGVIGHVRESLSDGLPIEAARKVFSATVKKRAQAAGLEL